MKNAPYSYQEAEKIAHQHGHLVGQRFAAEGQYVIESVVVCPFDELNKSRFLQLYMLCGDCCSALTGDYMGLLFDVIVIGRSPENELDLVQDRLATWLATNTYSFTIKQDRQRLNMAV